MTDQSNRQAMILPKGVFNMRAVVRPVVWAVPTTYPLKLSAKAQFVGGVAALVFVSPHVLDASQDQAEFGLSIQHLDAVNVDDKREFTPPHTYARLVAWFRATDSNRNYLIEFTACGIGSFTLVDGEGGSEVEEAGTASRDVFGVWTARISRTFQGGSKWRWFSLASDNWWKLLTCEIRQL